MRCIPLRSGTVFFFSASALLFCVAAKSFSAEDREAPPRGYSVPLIDLAGESRRQIIVDRDPREYLGHPTTVLLEDNKTMLIVYPKGHGRGAIVLKRSNDGGSTWSDRLPVPASWATSIACPTIFRVVDPKGVKRLVLFSGSNVDRWTPIRMSSSEDDGHTWTELAPACKHGGQVTMCSVVRLKDGRYMALYHDDGRFFPVGGGKYAPGKVKVYKKLSSDGGLTWSPPEVIATHDKAYLCEPGAVRSPDGKQIAVLLREETRKLNSFVIFSNDEGETWSEPRELPGALTGDRHCARYAPDGRLFISFRDTTLVSPTRGDWVGWVGEYDDIVEGREGQYRVRLMDNTKGSDCAYPAVEVLPDGTFVATTYGHWTDGERPYIVSVRFKLEELDAKAAELERTAQGVVGIWREAISRDNVSGGLGHSDPEYLASLLHKAGFGVHLLTTDELVDRDRLRADRFDLLVLPYGELYPAAGAESLRRFLSGGGRLITLGGPCFRRPLYRSPQGWTDQISQPSEGKPPRPIVALSQESVALLRQEIERGEQPGKASLIQDDKGRPGMRVEVPDLQTYMYVQLSTETTADYGLLCFRARGDEETRQLCVEVNETDYSRWKAVVDLSTQWRSYEIPIGDFVSYATEHRGHRGDYLHAERARRVNFGYPSSLVGQGKRAFEISQIEWRAGLVAAEQSAGDRLLLSLSTDLIRAFGADLKNADRGGDITAFFNAQEFCTASGLRAAADQSVFPQNLEMPGPVSGHTAVILEDNAYILHRQKPAGHRPFLPTQRMARVAPLLLTAEGQPAASLFLHTAGPYAGAVWACFGVTNRDIFPRDDPTMAKAFVALADRMLGGASLTAIEPRFDVADGRARMRVFVESLNHGLKEERLELRSRVVPLKDRRGASKEVASVELEPGQRRKVLALEVGAEQFDWKRFTVETQLVRQGRVLDTIRTSVDVRSVLAAICDRFVETQKQRGDGTMSGVGFVDNRGVRALLASYDLFGKKEYLDAAIRWGDATVAEQRDDGGYLMGYGYHPDGDACYVADGGEIACGVARLVSYVPQGDKKGFLESLRAYMAYRDSFRCEGGGIGVGWCRHDYGVRPIKPLDKITKIFAPELNIYTIGCTLTAASMYAKLTGEPRDHAAAVEDAYWWLKRCGNTYGGAFVESAVWAHKLLRGDEIRAALEQFLRQKFVATVVESGSPWWTSGGGRTVQGIDGLAYYYDCIEQDPKVLAALMRATYHVCSQESLAGIPRVLAKGELNADEWRYLHFASVSLPNLLESEVIRNDEPAARSVSP